MHLLPSLFSKFQLTDVELLEGTLLNTNQKAVIQNLLADTVADKILLKFDPDNIAAFQQREAELQGQIGILQYLIATSDEAEEMIRTNNLNQQPE